MCVTLAANELDTQAWMTVPVNCVELDKTSENRFIEVRVFDRVRVHITFKHLTHTQHTPSLMTSSTAGTWLGRASLINTAKFLNSFL